MTEWACIYDTGTVVREDAPAAAAVVVMLWPIWQRLPSEQRGTLIMFAKQAAG